MGLVCPDSLAETLDGLTEAFFYGRSLPRAEREEAAEWIASRQGRPGSYAQLIAPTPLDFERGARLFTGEALSSHAGVAHSLGEEACRALSLLRVSSPAVCDALYRVQVDVERLLDVCEARGEFGNFCCVKCSVSLWRNLSAGGFEDGERRLNDGMKRLRANRTGDGRWGGYPFHYTLLALTGIDLPSAREEIRYAAPACERLARRNPSGDRYAVRRRDLAALILGKI